MGSTVGRGGVLVGAFAELRKAAVSFVMSFWPSVCPYAYISSVPNVRIFIKSGICVFFENLSRKLKISLKSVKKIKNFVKI